MHRAIERAATEEGFTLIELMIVIVILGVLAGIVIFAVGGITDRGTSRRARPTSGRSTGSRGVLREARPLPDRPRPDLTDPAAATSS